MAIAFVAFRGPGIFNLVLALSLGGWVGYARLVRGQVLAAREREFVEAARALGASDLRIIVRHILPNIIQPVIVQAAIGMAGAILAEATMSFLGLGVPPPTASWGAMLNDGRAHLFDAPHLVLFPALAVMLAVLSFNFIGDALRDYLDPALAHRSRTLEPASKARRETPLWTGHLGCKSLIPHHIKIRNISLHSGFLFPERPQPPATRKRTQGERP